MTKRNTHHIVPNPQGGWDVKKGGGEKAIKHFDRKSDAEEVGRQISQHQRSELVIHGKDGKIQSSDSHGHDPNPPRDKA